MSTAAIAEQRVARAALEDALEQIAAFGGRRVEAISATTELFEQYGQPAGGTSASTPAS